MWRWFDRTEDCLAIVLLGMTSLAILASAAMRAIGQPFPGGAELAQFLFIWTAVLGADITLRRGGQVRIDALTVRLPLPMLRLVTVICLLLMLGFLALLVWYGFPLALSNWQRPLGVAGLSYGYVTLALPVGAALMFVSLIRRVLDKGILKSLDPDDDVVEETL
ncbi:TRAP transporter small permease [Halomonas eurihalina]|uniref:TRAP transporter small permease protein n=1 Tax=Halomonas eurihalina TaxID=42566 RepID=A0A5D9DCE2_HALER|nr:TRAP transporter small permease subunit [Halomonas eurihalina]MDR5860262.1 TRAP transporter small permease subunit [Halomonas eurihalina]TZG40315.1 TRAP transporter small permease [Halomonas eurihalina]